MADTMHAFVLEEGPPRLVRDRPRPHPEGSLVRVRTRLAGICNTDLELARGYMGFRGVLGHEFVGEALDGRLRGRRVIGAINFACGACRLCEQGLGRHCPQRRVLGILHADGALAEEFLIPEQNLVEVPDAIADEEAVFAEPLAAACEILEQIGSVDGRRALVIGDGKLGPLIAQVLAADGARVVLEGHHTEALAWLGESGIRLAGEGEAEGGFEVVVEASGTTRGLERAIAACMPRATLVLKTTVAARHEIDLAPVVINEIAVVGSRCGRMEAAIAALAGGGIRVEPMISRRFALADVERAFATAAERGVRKVLVEAG